MKKKLLMFLTAMMIIILPLSIAALENNYKDIVHELVNAPVEEGKVNLYLFRGEGCPHCEDEIRWIEGIYNNYKDKVNFLVYEVWNDDTNRQIVHSVKESFGDEPDDGVPYSVIGTERFYGFGSGSALEMENSIRAYLGLDELTEPTYDPFSDKEYIDGDSPAQEVIKDGSQTTRNESNNASEWVNNTYVKVALCSFSVLVLTVSCYLIVKMIRKK